MYQHIQVETSCTDLTSGDALYDVTSLFTASLVPGELLSLPSQALPTNLQEYPKPELDYCRIICMTEIYKDLPINFGYQNWDGVRK